jgi:hypothetical protein
VTATTFTNEDDAREAIETTESLGGGMVVVTDYWLTPWIVFVSEDGDIYAHTVPDDGPEDTAFTLPIASLIADQPGRSLTVVWDGVTV